MFDTKIALVLRDDLAQWQKLNVAAFLMSGIVGAARDIIGEAYLDAEGTVYNALSIQPVVVLTADAETLRAVQRRALDRDVRMAAYVEDMFATGHDAANRAVFAETRAETARFVGIGLRAEKKLVDKITKGAKLHG